MFPFKGARHGKSDVLDVLAAIAKDYAIERYRPEIVIVENERAAVLSDATFVQRASARKLRFRIANFLRFRDGRLVDFREMTDTFDLVEQALGAVHRCTDAAGVTALLRLAAFTAMPR